MNTIENGQVIIDIFKLLKIYPTEDSKLARYLAITRLAGRIGLFLSNIKGFNSRELALSQKRIRALYNEVGLDDLIFKNIVKPWMIDKGLVYEDSDMEGNQVYISTIFSYDKLLESVTMFFNENVTEEVEKIERGVHWVYFFCSTVPRGEHELSQLLATNYSCQIVSLVLEIVKAYKILSFNKGHSTAERIVYNEKLWKNIDKKMLSALPSFPTDQRAYIEFLVNKIKENQGLPEEQLRVEARSLNSENIFDFCIRVGLINITSIHTASGKNKKFLTTPHFYAKVRDEFGEDVCDKVKLFLDSIRHGQFFGDGSTGRIKDPEALLRSLLNYGSLKGCDAIATDYTMAEKAGIIKVVKGKSYRDNRMDVVQADVIAKTLDVIQYKNIRETPIRQVQFFDTNGEFHSIQENRVKLAELPQELAEAEQELLKNLREGA